MNEIEVKKRGWVKNAAIVFLAVMLVLTFFSNTIMNRSLPEVAAQYIQSSTITARIRDSGTVVANELYEVITSQAYTVSEVRARLGDYVEPGDVLITLTHDGSAELEATEEELRLAELDLEKYLIESPDSNYASYHRAIANAKTDLTIAEERRDRERDKRNEARDALTQAENERDATGYNDAAYRNAESQINKATAARDAAAVEETNAQRNLDTYIANLGGPWMPGDEPTIILDPDPNTDYNKLLRALATARTAHTNAQNALDSLIISTNFAALQSAREKWELANTKVTSAENALDIANENLTSAERSVVTAQQGVDAANEALTEAQKSGGRENSRFSIEVREKNRTIELLQEKLEKLREEGSITEITAAVGGKITEVNISPGQQTVPDNPLMIIEVVDRGYTLSIRVTNEQSTRVNIGEVAEVDRGWWGGNNQLTAVLTNIRPDPQSPGTGRLLVFAVSGDNIESGTQLNITISQRSENYATVVPNSAVRTDTNGDFILIVETRSSPLRNRYIATRVDVNVLASDDVNSAISGAGLGGWNDFVITTSTRPIEPGMQIRLVDNP